MPILSAITAKSKRYPDIAVDSWLVVPVNIG
jgi:hypothetical protein